MNNRPSEPQRSERRQRPDRRGATRRAGPERRQGARRLNKRREFELDRREEERRGSQRRGVFDRRSWIGRRFTDRRGGVPSSFSTHETEEIRRMISQSYHEIECPRCRRRLPVDEPADAAAPVWDVVCEACNCAATIAGASAAAVLVVASDAMMRDALSLALSQGGHKVQESATGNEALRVYRTNVPDVVIVDIGLSDMDGIDLMRRLLRFDDQAKVIVIAGPRRHGAPDPLAMAKRLGASRILRKPFPPQEMLAAVGEVLRSRDS